MQTPMLITTEILSFRSDALASGQMHAAMSTAHHILAFQRGRAFSFFLPLFKRPAVAGYQPQEERGNKNEEQDSTQRVTSFAALRRDVNNV
jgi:hypothetical protein